MSDRDYEVTFDPLLLIVRGHRRSCECRFDDCAVEVVRCEHGRLDPHYMPGKKPWTISDVVCPGSPTLAEADDKLKQRKQYFPMHEAGVDKQGGDA